MKKIQLLSTLLFFTAILNAQVPLSGSFTDCNNRAEDIQATLGTGKALIIAHKGVDCSICVSQAPSLETMTSQNSNAVEVWCALTWKYNANTFANACQETNNWISTHSWSSIFTFPDSNRVFVNNATPRYYVYSPRDSTIKYQGSNRNMAFSVALQESIVGIQDQALVDKINWRIQNRALMIDNQSQKAIRLRVVDLKGSVIKEANIINGSNSIDLSDLRPSIYLLQFQSEEGAYSEKMYLR